ncbi:MAG: hypothetical protein ACRCST_11330 [Turicibacter sp.]
MHEPLEFVRPYYQMKDIMHDLSHINRVLNEVEKLIRGQKDEVDQVVITYAAYFHGFIYSHESEIFKWLS